MRIQPTKNFQKKKYYTNRNKVKPNNFVKTVKTDP